jgi:hypothetical protein
MPNRHNGRRSESDDFFGGTGIPELRLLCEAGQAGTEKGGKHVAERPVNVEVHFGPVTKLNLIELLASHLFPLNSGISRNIQD